MLLSLERYGQVSPVVVGEKGRLDYEMIDGFKRLRCLLKLKPEAPIRARILTGGPRSWKPAVLLLNWPKRSVGPLEEAMVIHAMVHEERMTQREIGGLLRKDKSWVSRRLALVKRLDDEVREHIQLGLIHPSAGRELALLPRGNQRHALKALVDYRLTQKELACLVKELLAGGPMHESRVQTAVNAIRGVKTEEGQPRAMTQGETSHDRQLEHCLSGIEKHCEEAVKLLAKWPSQAMGPALEKWAERAVNATDNWKAAMEYFYFEHGEKHASHHEPRGFGK